MATKYPAIYARCKSADLSALARVAKHLLRSESDTVRFLIQREDSRIRSIKRASVKQPESVTVQVTELGEQVIE